MKKIKSALISVFNKEGIDELASYLHHNGVKIISTGGTQAYLEDKGIEVTAVESLTGYPSILGGRVKTLHPVVFGGILAKRETEHLNQLEEYNISPIDMVIVDLYPFEKTVEETDIEEEIIEKIDIGGIALIRAAAKNYEDICILSHRGQYDRVHAHLRQNKNTTNRIFRKALASEAFSISSRYDNAIRSYLAEEKTFVVTERPQMILRYGENPHQNGSFYGKFNEIFLKLSGKALSYNNLVDVDAAWSVMSEFQGQQPTCAILKHTNTCGVAMRDTPEQAWKDALAGDPISAFGGIIIFNTEIDVATAQRINELFYEVLIAPGFSNEAKDVLFAKKKRILLEVRSWKQPTIQYKTVLNGVIVQDKDLKVVSKKDVNTVTKQQPTKEQLSDLLFANHIVKHLKSNAIILAKDKQLLGMGCGQTSRVDALKQAIHKSQSFGFSLEGAVMASDAFFPFPDCVEIADKAGIEAVIQPGGSIKDAESIAYCDAHRMAMIFTSFRHFKH